MGARYRDYAVFVGEVAVCAGPLDYVADALGVGLGTMHNYAGKSGAVCGITVVSLGDFWKIPGIEAPVSSESACETVGCDFEQLKQKAMGGSDGVSRYRIVPWALPGEKIDALRRVEKRRRMAHKKAGVGDAA